MENLLCSWQQRNRVDSNNNSTPTAAPPPPPPNPGLDPKIIQSFPTFSYSSVKDYRKEKYGLECAICLIEFENDDVLRLLTLCCHVFHQECIDLWLEFHNTCPVCRRGLDEYSAGGDNMQDIIEDSALEDSLVVSVKDDENGVGERERMSTDGNDEHHRDQGQINKSLKFSRSHSTGHSIVKNRGGEGEDKFTLRLPEHVKAKIIKGHNPTRSCIPFGKTAEEKNGGFVETAVSYGGEITINRL